MQKLLSKETWVHHFLPFPHLFVLNFQTVRDRNCEHMWYSYFISKSLFKDSNVKDVLH